MILLKFSSLLLDVLNWFSHRNVLKNVSHVLPAFVILQMEEMSVKSGVAKNSLTVLVDVQGASLRHMAPSVINTSQKRTV